MPSNNCTGTLDLLSSYFCECPACAEETAAYRATHPGAGFVCDECGTYDPKECAHVSEGKGGVLP